MNSYVLMSKKNVSYVKRLFLMSKDKHPCLQFKLFKLSTRCDSCLTSPSSRVTVHSNDLKPVALIAGIEVALGKL